MSFHSLEFAAFFAAVVTVYYLVPHRRRVGLLLAASALFYMTFVPKHIFLVMGMIVVDYYVAFLIEGAQTQKTRRWWLVLSLAANLGVMATFKYGSVFTGGALAVIPLGLSFHTFQAMAYTVDVFRGRQPAERSFSSYALYILFFPKISAGPIERPQSLLEQFRKPVVFSYANTVAGLQLMIWGMFQKFVIADRLALFVDVVYRDPGRFGGPLVAFGAVCFSFQMLCDFAGYSDIAIGAAQVLGFRLTPNFNSPFHADSMAEYWKRWHISLSSWMRDYLFFPLCGRRPSMVRICGSIIVVFLANALWHGARINFLVSGLLHGIYRVVELLAGRAMSRAGWSAEGPWGRPLQIGRTLLVFSLMTFAFVFFRGESLSQSLAVLGRLGSGWAGILLPGAIPAEWAKTGLPLIYLATLACAILIIEAVQLLRSTGPLRPRIAVLPFWFRWPLYYAVTAAVLLFAQPRNQSFIYARF